MRVGENNTERNETGRFGPIHVFLNGAVTRYLATIKGRDNSDTEEEKKCELSMKNIERKETRTFGPIRARVRARAIKGMSNSIINTGKAEKKETEMKEKGREDLPRFALVFKNGAETQNSWE